MQCQNSFSKAKTRLHMVAMGPSAVMVIFLWFSFSVHGREDTLMMGEAIGFNQTLISAAKSFAFGFFRPQNNTRSYVGIWYYSLPGQTVVWVANRESPLEENTSGVIRINRDGNLVILSENGSLAWSSDAPLPGENTSAVLLESGNLVLKDEMGRVLWQSFDQPADTYLFGMEAKVNLTSGKTVGLVSSKDANDPSPGEYSFNIDPVWPMQLILKKGSQRQFRGGPWNMDLVKSLLASENSFNFTAYTAGDEVIISFTLINPSSVSRISLTPFGSLDTWLWLNSSRSWNLVARNPKRPCGFYGHCGPFGICSAVTAPECQCLAGYVPLRREEWGKANWTSGCVRRSPLACNNTDGFVQLGNMKLPDFPISIGSMSLSDCRSQCLQNCSCIGYSLSVVIFRPSQRCLIWTGDMVDLESNSTMGQDLYIRLASSELGTTDSSTGISKGKASNKRRILIAILIPTASIAVFVFILLGYFSRKRRKTQELESRIADSSPELPFFSFSSILAATDNFSEEMKLGKGGFGTVYKGKLPNGQEVAVKRLSQNSGQGLEEFKNELELIANLQHKNLVRLLGWCIHGEEQILLYEFMPNKSLDKFLFDPTGAVKLDWGKRFHIAQEIAQGLLYLHQFSRLRIIHRDLKASNILLDSEMNPKISDFGLARIFGGNQTEGNTKRAVGTLGYMAPEYALDGLFSEKSDVFSYGVLLLEIVTGKRSTGLYPFRDSVTLLSYVWSLWRENRTLELIDPSVGDSFVTHEVARCIQVGLLCVQERAADRLNMSSVISMLGNENAALPSPNQPAFLDQRSAPPASALLISQNELTLSVVEPR